MNFWLSILLIAVIVVLIIVSGFLGYKICERRENFSSVNYAKARDINKKVGHLFNEGKENYRDFRDAMEYGDAVLYDDLKKMKKRDGKLTISNIAEVI